MIRVRRDNEKLIQDQEKILKSLSDRQNQATKHPSVENEPSTEPEDQNNAENKTEKSVSPRSKNRNYQEAESGNLSGQQDLKRQKVELQGEFRKIKPPTFDGEVEEAAEAWLININKYFQVYEYNSNLKARLAIYQLRDKATLWWEEVKNVRVIDERDITWELFQQYFKNKYLTERFYDDKAKEFHDLKLGQMTIDDFVTKFTSLLRYVPYLREEKAKVQRFLSSLPAHMRERIEFVNPQTMDQAIRKA